MFTLLKNAAAHTANSSINVLKETFEDTMISCRLWPARLQTLSLWANLKLKFFWNNTHTLNESWHIVCDKVIIIFLAFSGTPILKPLVGAGRGSCYLNGTQHSHFYPYMFFSWCCQLSLKYLEAEASRIAQKFARSAQL
jgi:hypothetical protein